MILSLPWFSYVFLQYRFELLENKKFKTKYGTLYQNLYPLKHTAYKMTTIFCIKRLIYAYTTIMLSKYLLISNMYTYFLIPIFSLGYNMSNRPMNSKILNYMENINEFFILFNAYFIPIFTQWICDPV